MAIIFDGKAFALKKEEKLAKKVLDLKSRGIYPHLASIIVGDSPASAMYVSMKKKRAEAIGIQVSVYKVNLRDKKEDVLKLIEFLNNDPDFTGIMIQMPIPGELSKYEDEFVDLIDPNKDVDGLKIDSKFLHPTSKAVLEIIDFAKDKLKLKGDLTCLVNGATGMVGKPLVTALKKLQSYKVIECNSKTINLQGSTLQSDIIVSTTGIPDIIKGGMVKKGAIIVDVGSPKGDVDFEGVSKVAGFVTPVPGGVGPVTISCLLENLTLVE
jgi:methylenetetrahydrofolate dehydrogenase (NADP+)/methenyltetrahydrofolate cyclohydrolase